MQCKQCEKPVKYKTAEMCDKHYRQDLKRQKLKDDPNLLQREAKRTREWRANNLKKAIELDKNRYQKRKENIEYKEKRKYAWIKRIYNLTKEEYDEMISKGCEICGSFKKLHVDHCHDKNIVRGILCHKCNLGLGFVERPDMWLLKAEVYLFQKRVAYNLECIKKGEREKCYSE